MFTGSKLRASFPLSCFFVIADYFAVFVQSARENLGHSIHLTRQLCLHLWTHRMHFLWYAFCPLGLRKNAHSSFRFIYHRLSNLVKLAVFFGPFRLCKARLRWGWCPSMSFRFSRLCGPLLRKLRIHFASRYKVPKSQTGYNDTLVAELVSKNPCRARTF